MREDYAKDPSAWTKKIIAVLPSKAACAAIEKIRVSREILSSDPLCLNMVEGGMSRRGL